MIGNARTTNTASGQLAHPLLAALAAAVMSGAPCCRAGEQLEAIRVSDDGRHFVRGQPARRWVAWGVNYDHDARGRLLDEYWLDEWRTVVGDFGEIRDLGANCVRVHLQFGKFMDTPDRPNKRALEQLARLVELAEKTGLYLDLTGLACYHKKNIPAWFDELPEQDRWAAQAVFWRSVAKTCRESPAIFCYDLMNEPVLPGEEPRTEWLGGELGGKYFVQFLTLDLNGRSREEVAKAWLDRMVGAIREHDDRHLVTVGVIPWVFVFGGGKPLFHSPEVGGKLDFVAVHLYPERDRIEEALQALQAYQAGKPLVIEEMFPLKCGGDELADFVRRSSGRCDGWISFYWGRTAGEYRAIDKPGISDLLTASWLETFGKLSGSMAAGGQ